MLYSSIEETGANNSLHRIQQGPIKLFEGDRTTVSVPVPQTRSERMRNDLRKEIYMSKGRESLLAKLRASYGKVYKVKKPGARGSAVRLREFHVSNKALLSRSRVGGCVAVEILNCVGEVKGEDVESDVTGLMVDVSCI